jgi:S1-C subfamily serine protease
VLFSSTRLLTFAGQKPLTSASGFFFARDERLYLGTSRHVLFDQPSAHAPDRIEIELHVDAEQLTQCATLSIRLYDDARTAVWRQAEDGGGDIDVAVLELDREALPEGCVIHPFEPAHMPADDERIEVGDRLAIPGFPLGFHDTVYHLPVVRQATIASAYGIRFQGKGFFLTDGRTHRGSSGSPVLRRTDATDLPWQLIGVHSSRMDMATRDLVQDESLGLNCAWYADILLTLTEP